MHGGTNLPRSSVLPSEANALTESGSNRDPALLLWDFQREAK